MSGGHGHSHDHDHKQVSENSIEFGETKKPKGKQQENIKESVKIEDIEVGTKKSSLKSNFKSLNIQFKFT
jgi:hypothetical protein